MKLIKLILSIFFVVMMLGVIYYTLIMLSARDIKNVNCSGYILDENTKKPISDVIVSIDNDRYVADDGGTNYDEYLGHDRKVVRTNKEGFFKSSFERSSFIWITVEKEGYKKHIEEGKISSKSLNYRIYLGRVSK